MTEETERLAIVGWAVLALGAGFAVGWVFTDKPERVEKTCDAGRAVYTFKDRRAGGVTVVENAPECVQ